MIVLLTMLLLYDVPLVPPQGLPEFRRISMWDGDALWCLDSEDKETSLSFEASCLSLRANGVKADKCDCKYLSSRVERVRDLEYQLDSCQRKELASSSQTPALARAAKGKGKGKGSSVLDDLDDLGDLLLIFGLVVSFVLFAGFSFSFSSRSRK